MQTRDSLRQLCFALTLGLVALMPACTITITPPPEAVLEGTWLLTTEASTGLSETYLTFDANGQLDQVRYKINNISVTNNSPRAQTNVDGDNVTISATFGLNSLKIVGTLNADKTVITGTQGTEIQILNVTITIDGGAVTLTKQ